MNPKKFLMLHVWRLEQTRVFISTIFWSLMLTGIFYARLQYYLHKYFGFSENENEQVIIKMSFIFFFVLLLTLLFGFVYDAIFRMWEERMTVQRERNPYALYKFNGMQSLQFKHYFLPVMKKMNKDGGLDENIAMVEMWLEKVLNSDDVLKRDLEYVEEWVESEEEVWIPPNSRVE